MLSRLGLDVVGVDVDTDSFGTFAGEIPRPGSPWETAVAKARLGMASSGLGIGIASEGSIGPYGGLPFVIADVELVVLVDDERDLVIGETETEFGVPTMSVRVGSDELPGLDFAAAGFPEHGLIVRPSEGFVPIFKGIHARDELERAVDSCAEASTTKKVVIESDLRAHHHPTRREVIARAAERLAERLESLCPTCGTPGWGVGEREAGAPCGECRFPTRVTRLEFFVCGCCAHRESKTTPDSQGVDPQYCPLCNP